MKEQVETPFGKATLHLAQHGANIAAVLPDAADVRGGLQIPQALIYAAKVGGATRVVEVVRTRALDRLLPDEGYVLPPDLVDLTRGKLLTFFVGKGYGFLPQQTPFCPEMRSALVPAVRVTHPLSAARGTFAALDEWEQTDEATAWGAQLAGIGVSPATFLARELELCYTPLCLLGDGFYAIEAVVEEMLTRLPQERQCLCRSAMQGARDRGLVGPDWRAWLP